MTGNLQPLDQKFPIVTPDGRPTLYFIKWAQQKQIDISEGITAEQALQIIEQYLADHTLQEGSGISISPSGNLSDTPTITAEVQAILDQITNVRGSILFRGAAGWEALAPGLSGQFLKTMGAGADPVWAAGGGGGGSGPYAYATRPSGTFTVPNTSASFTLIKPATTLVVDTGGFWDVGNTGVWTIPPGVSLVEVAFFSQVDSSDTFANNQFVFQNNVGGLGTTFSRLDGNWSVGGGGYNNPGLNVISAISPVAAGDIIGLYAATSATGALNTKTTFQIKALA